MTPQGRNVALGALEKWESAGAGAYRRRTAKRLRRLLEREPDQFWQSFLEVTDYESNPLRVEVDALLRTGRVTPSTTFSELQALSGSNPARGGDAE